MAPLTPLPNGYRLDSCILQPASHGGACCIEQVRSVKAVEQIWCPGLVTHTYLQSLQQQVIRLPSCAGPITLSDAVNRHRHLNDRHAFTWGRKNPDLFRLIHLTDAWWREYLTSTVKEPCCSLLLGLQDNVGLWLTDPLRVLRCIVLLCGTANAIMEIFVALPKSANLLAS